MNRRIFLSFSIAACSGVPFAAPGMARAAGTTPLTIVIPFAPGGASDLVVRSLADGMARDLGRPMVIENKGGAGGLIAAAAVGRAAPDGNTLLYGNQGQMVVARHLFPVNGPAPQSMLTPLALTARTQFCLVVPMDSPAARAPALVEAGQRGRLKFGIPGIGSPPHLATVLLAERTGTVIDVIPYQGSAPMLIDLIAGRLDAAFDNVSSSLQHVRAGRLRALGVSSATGTAAAPDIPPLAGAGIEGYAYQSWQGLFAPKGIAAESLSGIVTSVRNTLADPAVRQRLDTAGLDAATGSTADFEALIARDTEAWDARVRRGMVRPA